MTRSGPDRGAALLDRIRLHFGDAPPVRLGVAVSGGSDSVAMLCLLHDWSCGGGPDLQAVTVDHGVRRDAAAEAEQVSAICHRMGIAHDTLRWRPGPEERGGNFHDRARRARYALMADWARRYGITDIAIGHTRDDQAETFLMRLARGAGLDGLAAMRPRWEMGDVIFHRPMLDLGRDALQQMLRGRSVGWSDDPGNSDSAFLRTRARAALGELAPLGLDAATLSAVARNLGAARDALAQAAQTAGRDLCRVEAGDLLIDRAGFVTLPDAVARRLLQGVLRWINGEGYGPRGAALSLFLDAARSGKTMTLQGCLLSAAGSGSLRVTREFDAVRSLRCPADGLWDGRWQALGPDRSDATEIAALGPEGLRACPDWRESGLPHASALALPGLWRGENLVAAPLAGWANGWALHLRRDRDKLLALTLSH